MIPEFDSHGVLPPLRPGEHGASADRAPYPADMLTLCQRFGQSEARAKILRGLLKFRLRLQSIGLDRGFQWLNGSFLEDVERLRGRPPADIDVVTICPLGNQRQLAENAPELLKPDRIRERYGVDHYFVGTDEPLSDLRGRTIAYWYSMWSRQRESYRWKGFVSVPLPSNDGEALGWMNQRTASSSDES